VIGLVFTAFVLGAVRMRKRSHCYREFTHC